MFGMIVTAYPSSDVTRDEFTRAGHEFTTSDLCGINFDLRLSRCRTKTIEERTSPATMGVQRMSMLLFEAVRRQAYQIEG